MDSDYKMNKSRKQEILDCAAQLFRKQGFKGTSVKEIAGAIGIEPPSLYNHISSKNKILEELLMQMAHLFTQGMTEISDSSLSPLEKLEKLVGLHVRLTVQHTDAIALITGEWVHLSNDAKPAYLSLRNDYEQKFKSILEEAQQLQQIRIIDIDIALFSMLSTLHWLYSWYSRQDNVNPIELEKQIITCLIKGLKQ